MDNNHIIIGYGNWAKKIVAFLKNRKIFSNIYVKTTNKYFECIKNKNISKEKFLKIQKKVDSVHICTPVNSHFYYLSKFINLKRIIVEKPFLKNLSEFNKIQKMHFKKSLLYVNYTYLFSPILLSLKKEINKKSNKKIILNFSKKNSFYKKKFDCINDWLDHPLSIILYLFKSYPKFKIIKKDFLKKKGFYEKLVLNYFYKNLVVEIRINISKSNKRNIVILSNSKKKVYDFKSNKFFFKKKSHLISNKSSFEKLYSAFNNNKKINFQNLNFHKKIMIEKSKIIKKLKYD